MKYSSLSLYVTALSVTLHAPCVLIGCIFRGKCEGGDVLGYAHDANNIYHAQMPATQSQHCANIVNTTTIASHPPLLTRAAVALQFPICAACHTEHGTEINGQNGLRSMFPSHNVIVSALCGVAVVVVVVASSHRHRGVHMPHTFCYFVRPNRTQ